ncbi:hypothetical protein ES708_29146 [subsurface metagenome]
MTKSELIDKVGQDRPVEPKEAPIEPIKVKRCR